jgi:TM2 domain-containing membrane protein YozV
MQKLSTKSEQQVGCKDSDDGGLMSFVLFSAGLKEVMFLRVLDNGQTPKSLAKTTHFFICFCIGVLGVIVDRSLKRSRYTVT